MIVLKIYLIGVAVAVILTALVELFYNCKGHVAYISYLKFQDVAENLTYSLLSWLGVLGVVLYFVGEWCCNFPDFGCISDIAEYEKYLKRRLGVDDE